MWSTSFPSRKAAETALREELGRRDQGIVLDSSKITVAAFIDRFLSHMARIREPKTIHRYGELLRGHVVPTLGGIQLRQLEPLHVQQLYDQLAVTGRRDGKGGLHPRTILHVHRALHRALRQAVRWRLVVRNVCEAVDPPAVPKMEATGMTREQARALLEAAADVPPWLMIFTTLGLATGCRRGELLALTWANLNLDVGTARIRRSLGLVGNALTWKAPKSEAGERTVELPTFALAALRVHRRRQAELRLVFGDAYDAEADLVVAMPDGRPVRPDYASAAFRALVKQAGLPAGIDPHTMRHAVASFLADDGEPATVIASQLGHRDGGALAQRTYIHALPEAAARVAGRLEETLGTKPERIRTSG
jgi:integrase